MEDSGVTSRDEGKEDRGINIVTVNGGSKSEQQIEVEQLVPGIPDEITINEIATKLPWKAFHTLSSVSCGWRRAIQSHQVYDARVRSKCTQTLVAFKNLTNSRTKIFLYSIEDPGSWYSLPMIPSLQKGFPVKCQCIFLDGKVYVLGGLKDISMVRTVTAVPLAASPEVYVLDVAGQGEWRQCARMKHPRIVFSCGAQGGKIYVFGGCTNRLGHGSEVYDPKEDMWSPIKPTPSKLQFSHKVTTVGEELFVHPGKFYVSHGNGRNIHDALSADVYHPVKNEWRIVEKFIRSWQEEVLMVGGILHKLTKFGIQAYDSRADSWKPLQPFSSVRLNSNEGFIDSPKVLAAVGVDDEIFAMAILQVDHSSRYERCLVRSQGVCGENKEIVWHKLPFPSVIEEFGVSHLSAIYL